MRFVQLVEQQNEWQDYTLSPCNIKELSKKSTEIVRVNSILNIDETAFLPSEKLVTSETADRNKAKELAIIIERNKKFVRIPVKQYNEKFVILNGHHRFLAATEFLGKRYVPVCIIKTKEWWDDA